MTRRIRHDRRTVLRGLAAGAVGLTGLAGCLEQGGGNGGGGGTEENPFASDGSDGTATDGTDAPTSDGTMEDGSTAATTEADGETTASDDDLDVEIGIAEAADFGGHPAAQDLAGQPYFGPQPGEAPGTVIAFEDPSCPRCRSFERGTVEEIRTQLAANGDATFVFRGYPIIYEWGEPATKVLESTLARSPRAHFAMAREYFLGQDSYDADNVYLRSQSRLAGLADVDAEAVVEDARNGAFDDAVETDLAAGEAADASSTPAVYMFRDDEFRTKAEGSVSFEAVETALGL